MSQPISIFISHSWSDWDSHASFSRLLDAISDFTWHDVSVKQTSPFKAEVSGQPAKQQELELQRMLEDRLWTEEKIIYRELTNLESRLSELEYWKSVSAEKTNLKREIAECDASPFSGYMLSLLEKTYRKPIQELRSTAEVEAAMVPLTPNISEDITKRVLTLKQSRNVVQGRIEDCQRRIDEIKRGNGFTVRTTEREKILQRYFKVPPGAVNENPNLVMILEREIARSDVVIVIAEMFSQYGKWMATELRLAGILRRPVLAVIPLRQSKCPKEVEHRADAIVCWDAIEIGKALLRLTYRDRNANTGHPKLESSL